MPSPLAADLARIVGHRWVRERHAELANGGMIFLAILCLVKATDWWWDWLPHWLFFLILAGFAIGVMAALKRVRRLLPGRDA